MWRANSLEKTLMLGKVEGRRSGWRRMRWLNSITDSIITDSMDMNLGKYRDIAEDTGAWHSTSMGSQGAERDWATEQQKTAWPVCDSSSDPLGLHQGWTFLLPLDLKGVWMNGGAILRNQQAACRSVWAVSQKHCDRLSISPPFSLAPSGFQCNTCLCPSTFQKPSFSPEVSNIFKAHAFILFPSVRFNLT